MWIVEEKPCPQCGRVGADRMPRSLLNKWFRPHHFRHRCIYCRHEFLRKAIEIPEYRVSHFAKVGVNRRPQRPWKNSGFRRTGKRSVA